MVKTVTQAEAITEGAKLSDLYQSDPCRFMVEVLGMRQDHIWPKMREIIESVRDHQLTAVPAGHSVSKTYSAARIALWFKSCFRPSTVITTAPSDNQVRNQLWREIHTAYQGARWPLGGSLKVLEWDCRPDPEFIKDLPGDVKGQWEKNFAIGFSTTPDSVSDHATRMHGWHNKWLLVILDEAAGILPPIWRSVLEGLIVNKRCKVLAIGNPTEPSGMFYKVCQPSSGWNVIRVSVHDTPNYIEGREVVPQVAGRDFEDRIIAEYGEGSNEHKYRCLGEFPEFGEGSVFEQTVFEYQRRFLRDDYETVKFDYRGGEPIRGEGGGWLYLNTPVDHEYVIGVDTAEYRLSDPKDPLSKRDYDAAVVLDRNTSRVVAVLNTRLNHRELGRQILGAARHYGNAWIVPEIPQGLGILQIFRDAKYDNIYRPIIQRDSFDPQEKDELWGYRTTDASRKELINDLRSYLRINGVMLQFEPIVQQMTTFRWDKTGKPIHAPGHHDDLIFALGLALQGHLQCPRSIKSMILPSTTGSLDEPSFLDRERDKDYDLAFSGAVDHFDPNTYDDEEWMETTG